MAVADTILMLTRKPEETEGKLYVTGRDVEECTIEMEITENWLWYDKRTDFTATTLLPEVEHWQGQSDCKFFLDFSQPFCF